MFLHEPEIFHPLNIVPLPFSYSKAGPYKIGGSSNSFDWTKAPCLGQVVVSLLANADLYFLLVMWLYFYRWGQQSTHRQPKELLLLQLAAVALGYLQLQSPLPREQHR
jgi:hypothetical protein